MKNYFIKYFLFIVLITFISLATAAQPGTLDARFGEQGKIYDKDFGGTADIIAVQKDGKVLAAGYYTAEDGGIQISRFTTDGAIDVSFATEGRRIFKRNAGYNFYLTQNILVQTDGKIIVDVRTTISTPDKDISLIRLNTDGSLDNSFGTNGIVNLAIGPYDDLLGEIALQEDGKIVVAGLKDPAGFGYYDNEIPFLLRLNTDGSYDNSFGENGIVVQNFNDVYVRINALLILPDGKIIMGGNEDGDNDDQVVMFKYNPDGSPDLSFGNQGIAESDFEEDANGKDIISSIYDLLLLPGGKIWASGVSSYGTIFISKFNTDGSLDSGFGTNGGFYSLNMFSVYGYAYQSHIVKGNKILVTGTRGGGFAAFRFLSNGTLDSSFGVNGISANYFDFPSAMGKRGSVLQQDGKIVLAGMGSPERDDYFHICMLRLHGDGGIDAGSYVKIKRWMKKNGISWWPGGYMSRGGSYTVQRSTDGQNFTTIASVNKPASAGANEYSYEDPSPAKGNNYYRLTYTNAAGKTVYSNIISIEDVAAVHIYPNPVTNYVNVTGINNKTNLYITDISGNVKMVTNTTNKNFHWNVATLSKGYYILRLETEGKEPVIKKFYKE